ncbi:hypothetical protein D3C74_490160 [compost metagenome]
MGSYKIGMDGGSIYVFCKSRTSLEEYVFSGQITINDQSSRVYRTDRNGCAVL